MPLVYMYRLSEANRGRVTADGTDQSGSEYLSDCEARVPHVGVAVGMYRADLRVCVMETPVTFCRLRFVRTEKAETSRSPYVNYPVL